MRLGKAAVVGCAGVVTGLVLGYVLWGLQVSDLSWTLGKTKVELVQTKAWLLDEIRSSDERHEQVSASLTKALADLASARAQLARISATSRQQGPGGDPGGPAGTRAATLTRTGF